MKIMLKTVFHYVPVGRIELPSMAYESIVLTVELRRLYNKFFHYILFLMLFQGKTLIFYKNDIRISNDIAG